MAHFIHWYEDIKYDNCIEHIPHCKCSNCEKEFDSYSSQFMSYCSNCGERMDGHRMFVDNINHPTQNLLINNDNYKVNKEEK